MMTDHGKYFQFFNVILEDGRLFTSAVNIATNFTSFKNTSNNNIDGNHNPPSSKDFLLYELKG
jgi:hypothetical protein